jgi:hypothetical protein
VAHAADRETTDVFGSEIKGHWPFVDIRKLWAPHALQRKEPEIAGAEAHAILTDQGCARPTPRRNASSPQCSQLVMSDIAIFQQPSEFSID